MTHKICSTNEDGAILSPGCYNQPEVQKDREVTTQKAWILVPIIGSFEKYNRKTKLTKSSNWASIFSLLLVPWLQLGRHNCSTTTGKSVLTRSPTQQCLEKLWNAGHLTKPHETTKLFDIRTPGNAKLQWKLLFIVTVTTNWEEKNQVSLFLESCLYREGKGITNIIYESLNRGCRTLKSVKLTECVTSSRQRVETKTLPFL